jgi:hypothetical protein
VSQADEDETLPAEQEAALLAALEAALRPSELDPELNERLIELSLEDPLAPPSAEELVESERLRDALEHGGAHEDADVLRALQATFADEPRRDHDGAVERALDGALGSTTQAPPKRGNVVYAVFGAAGAVLAAAAAVALFLGTLSRGNAPAASAGALVRPHSTAPLFAERFETGDTTARMDLIASARSRDLRDNRYAAWGVR